MAKSIVEMAIIDVSVNQMDKLKKAFSYSPLPLDSSEIIIEATEVDIDDVQAIVSEAQIGYNIFYISRD